MIDTVIQGDVLEKLPEIPTGSVNCCVTSPPYWGLRDYGVDGQLGLEKTPEEYVAKMVAVFREVWRVLRDDGTLWLNLGDSYVSNPSGKSNGGLDNHFRTDERDTLNKSHQGAMTRRPINLKPKDLCGIPWRVAFALQADGWYLRQDIIWSKPNPMPESVRDRCTKSHEYIFLLTKKPRYYYDADAIREPHADTEHTRARYGYKPSGGKKHDANKDTNIAADDFAQYFTKEDGKRNKRSVWTVTTKPYSEAHFATFPPDLILPCILAGCPQQVCKKCGEPRVRIIDKPKPPKEMFTETRREGADSHVGGMTKDGKLIGMGQKLQNWLTEHPAKTTGWTDCGCKQYFCNNCKKFLTPELIDGIMNAKGDDYAIQGHREKEEMLKGFGKEKVSRTAGAGGVVEADSVLCKKNMSDLWGKILREKDATDLFAEVWGSVTDTKRESQRVSEGGTPSKLQGRVSEQERVQSNPDTEEVCDGTPLLDGAALGTEADPERGSSPQERGEKRQQIEQPCNKSENGPSRDGVVSALQKEFQAEIACPYCLSSQITIEPAGFDGGVVLDPFGGAFTTALVAYQNNRHYTIIELSEEYVKLGTARLDAERENYGLLES